MEYTRARNILRPIINALWRIEIIDKEKFVEGKGVYICNHLSIMDCNAMSTRLFNNKINFVVKEDSVKGKLGQFLMFMGGIPIKRGENDLKAVKSCLKVLKEDKPLIIFPEGTRNLGNPKKLLPFKDGPAVFAIKTKSPVYPMLYYRKPSIRHKNYMIIGDPIDLSEFYGAPIHEARDLATEKLETAMRELRVRLDNIVENKANLKAYRKSVKLNNKEAKRLNKLSAKHSKVAKAQAVDVNVIKENDED